MKSKNRSGLKAHALLASVLWSSGCLTVMADVAWAQSEAEADAASTESSPAEPAEELAPESAPDEAAAEPPAAVEASTAAAPAAAIEPSEDGKKKNALKDLKLALGLRAGYAKPFGDFAEGSSLESNVSGGIPIGIDAALRLKGYELGLYGSVLLGFAGSDLERGCGDCSVFGFRFGAQANYHVLPEHFVDPWIGIGVGIEQLTYSETRTVQAVTNSGSVVDIDVNRSTDYRALPELLVQAGIDFGGGPISVGPYVSFSIAQYSTYEIEVKCNDFRCAETNLASRSGDIPNTATHMWLQAGVRGSYLLF